jgi:hypothetical protein
MIKALSTDINVIGITIAAVQNAQPTNAWARIIATFLILISLVPPFSSLNQQAQSSD